MLNFVSILFGLVALAIALVGMIIFLGWLNWIALPFAAMGAGLGALSRSNSGRNLGLIVLVVSAIRLSIGGGLL